MKNIFMIILIIFVSLCFVNTAFAQSNSIINVTSAIIDKSVETIEYYKLAVNDSVEGALFYDAFTSSEFIRIGRERKYLDVVYLVGYATSKESKSKAKELALESLYFVNNIEDVTDEDMIRLRARTSTFKKYDSNGEIVYGAFSRVKLTEYNTAPLKYIEKDDVKVMFDGFNKSAGVLKGFGRLLSKIAEIF